MTKTYMTVGTLARRLNVCNATLRSRIANGDITPDGLVIMGEKEPGLLFDVEKLSAIRKAMNPQPEVTHAS